MEQNIEDYRKNKSVQRQDISVDECTSHLYGLTASIQAMSDETSIDGWLVEAEKLYDQTGVPATFPKKRIYKRKKTL